MKTPDGLVIKNCNNRNGKFRKKAELNESSYPQVYIDQTSDFASIKLASGVESKSYSKDGFIFCEDPKGNVIEIQFLNFNAKKVSKRRQQSSLKKAVQ